MSKITGISLTTCALIMTLSVQASVATTDGRQFSPEEHFFLLVFFSVSILIAIIALGIRDHYEAKRREERAIYIKNYEFPLPIINGFQVRHPELSNERMQEAISTLKDYFNLCLVTGNRLDKLIIHGVTVSDNILMLPMPSRLVDRLWDQFSRNSEEYSLFCQHGFGRFYQYQPPPTSNKDGCGIWTLAWTWKLTCDRENINPLNPEKLPQLFSIDTALQVDDGLIYDLAKCSEDYREYQEFVASCSI